ncbi:MAG: hypothetical protein Q9170_006479 [Blastenia crenularia]
MSQGPSASRASSSQNNNNRYKTLPPLESRTLPPINDASQGRSSENGERPTSSTKATPLQSPISQKSSRSLGMQNILNPPSKDGSENQSRRRKADQFELPSPATTAASRAPSTSMTPSPGTVSLPSITPPSMNSYPPPVGQGPRQILTPRSVSGYLPNLATHAIPGTIDAKVSPFVGSSEPMYTSVPEVSHAPNFSSAAPPGGPPYGVPFSHSRSPPLRGPSGGSQLPVVMDRRPSIAGSESPSTTYSSYSQFSRTPPPATQSTTPASQPSSAFFGAPYAAAGPVPSLVHGFGNHGPNSTTQSPYRMMTMDTEQGPIQVPVDVQAASKVADEKRKRNATASHRFRQRRKEKERETSQNIAKLEKQINDMAEEREFYRLERDYFRGLACRNPGQAHAPARPPSPRLQRPATSPADEEGIAGTHWHSGSEHGGQNGRNTRRRLSSYIPPQDMPQPANLGPAPQQQLQHQQTHPGYHPASVRHEDAHSHAPGRGRPSSTFPVPNHAAAWHPSHR